MYNLIEVLKEIELNPDQQVNIISMIANFDILISKITFFYNEKPPSDRDGYYMVIGYENEMVKVIIFACINGKFYETNNYPLKNSDIFSDSPEVNFTDNYILSNNLYCWMELNLDKLYKRINNDE